MHVRSPEIKRKTTLNSTPMKIEPKTFFANERTFLSWLHMAVTIGSIACALLGFAGSAHRSKKEEKVCGVCYHACHSGVNRPSNAGRHRKPG